MSEKVKAKKKVIWLKYFKEIKIKLRLREQNRWGFQGLSVNTKKVFTCEAKWKKRIIKTRNLLFSYLSKANQSPHNLKVNCMFTL